MLFSISKMNFTLEESTTKKVPYLLETSAKKILSHNHDTPDSIQKDLLFITLFVLLIENGFLPISDGNQMLDPETYIDCKISLKWKSPMGAYTALFVIYPFENMPLKFIMSPLGDIVVVNMVIIDLNCETYTICLPISRYVVSPQASSVPMIFRDLKHLSQSFKTKVLSAVKSKVLSHHGYTNASLTGLPQELLFKIVLHLPISDIISLSKTCKALNYSFRNNSLWHDIFKRDFGVVDQTENNNWKEVYRGAFITNSNKKQCSTVGLAGTLHDNMEYSDYVSYIDNPLWDVVI